MLHDISETAANAFTLGAGDWLSSKLPGSPSLSQIQGETEASRERVPWYVRTPIEVAAYGAGPGKALGALAGGSVLGEGALAGGLSGGFSSDFDPMRTAGNATVGAGLGALSGLIPKGVNAGLTKALGKEGTVDPAAAIASTAKDTADAYAALTKIPVKPAHVDNAIGSVMSKLDPSVETGMSPGLNSTINGIRDALDSMNTQRVTANANQVDSWQRQINAAARREAHPTDQIVAGKIDSALDGLMQQSGAGGLQKNAQAAFQKSTMAENLAEWQRKAAVGAPLGQAPLTEAETYYQGKPQYRTLADLYQQSQSQQDPSWALGHIAAGAIGDLAGASGLGFLGHLGGEALGYIGVKPMIKSAMKGVKQNALGRNIQKLYPEMTGVPLTGGRQAPQISPRTGDMIKNLMLGTAY
jgi:hypothetical protein